MKGILSWSLQWVMGPQAMVGFQAGNKEGEGKDPTCRNIKGLFNYGPGRNPADEHRSILQSAGLWGRTPGL